LTVLNALAKANCQF